MIPSRAQNPPLTDYQAATGRVNAPVRIVEIYPDGMIAELPSVILQSAACATQSGKRTHTVFGDPERRFRGIAQFATYRVVRVSAATGSRCRRVLSSPFLLKLDK